MRKILPLNLDELLSAVTRGRVKEREREGEEESKGREDKKRGWKETWKELGRSKMNKGTRIKERKPQREGPLKEAREAAKRVK